MTEPTIVDLQSSAAAVIRATVPTDSVRDFYDRAFGQVAGALAAQGVAPAGPALALYWGVPADTIDLACGFPTPGLIAPDGEVVPFEVPACRAAQAVHEGSYDTLGDTYHQLAEWMFAQGVRPGPLMWESYETEPTPDADPAGMRTRITWPLAAEEGGR